ncbi:MAG TPA: uracil-DNA glycosylase [Candidatus Binatia bacterium]|nr:uracil-DNA glycosylase [Candidatus Binatia bacterium]
MQSDIDRLNAEIVACRKCPRLVRWREGCAQEPPRRYKGAEYWARPLPGFGAARPRLLIVGLAPAAHGGNRTGRMFTGDRSGDWLYGALHSAGFASQPHSNHRGDGLELRDCYITAAVRCAPPENKPSNLEFKRCLTYLVQELRVFKEVRVVIVLGKIAFDSFIAAYRKSGGKVPKPVPKFGHGVAVGLEGAVQLLCSYHPSQQNTFTGKLTEPMFHAIFKQARALL